MSDTKGPAVLRRLAEGDARALAEFYDAHAGLAYGLALRVLRDRSDAEDVVQEAFVQVWRQADRYDPARGSPQAWLCAIVRTRALDRQIGTQESDPGAVHPGEVSPAYEAVTNRQLAAHLIKTLAALGH